MIFGALNLQQWVEDHRELLKPPVGNKMVWPDREFLVMVVGGPNQRKDFHIEDGEEAIGSPHVRKSICDRDRLRVIDSGIGRQLDGLKRVGDVHCKLQLD